MNCFALLDIKARQMDRRLNYEHTGPCVEHLVTPGMQVYLPCKVTLHICDEQEVKFKMA
jgi:hypothetical protein